MVAGAGFFLPSPKCHEEGLAQRQTPWPCTHEPSSTTEKPSSIFTFLHLQSTDEFSELSFRISELAREPRGSRERKEDVCGEWSGALGLTSLKAPLCVLTRPASPGDGDPEQIDFIDSHVPGEDEERGAAKVRGWPLSVCPSAVGGELEGGATAGLEARYSLSPSAVLSPGAAATRIGPCGRGRGEGTKQQVPEAPEPALPPFTPSPCTLSPLP